MYKLCITAHREEPLRRHSLLHGEQHPRHDAQALSVLLESVRG